LADGATDFEGSAEGALDGCFEGCDEGSKDLLGTRVSAEEGLEDREGSNEMLGLEEGTLEGFAAGPEVGFLDG
jgi:hypothetical protein